MTNPSVLLTMATVRHVATAEAINRDQCASARINSGFAAFAKTNSGSVKAWQSDLVS